MHTKDTKADDLTQSFLKAFVHATKKPESYDANGLLASMIDLIQQNPQSATQTLNACVYLTAQNHFTSPSHYPLLIQLIQIDPSLIEPALISHLFLQALKVDLYAIQLQETQTKLNEQIQGGAQAFHFFEPTMPVIQLENKHLDQAQSMAMQLMGSFTPAQLAHMFNSLGSKITQDRKLSNTPIFQQCWLKTQLNLTAKPMTP